MVPASLQEKPPTGIGIMRFAGGTFFPPGPQKSYHRKNPPLGLQSHFTTLVSQRSSDYSSKPSRSTTIRRPNVFEQWRTKLDIPVDIGNSGLVKTEIRDDSDSDPSDEDGGVALASSLAVFMRGPGEIKFPLHQTAPESAHQHSKAEHQKSESEGPKPQEVGIARKKKSGSRSSIKSQIAALLQTPGVLSSGPRRPSTPVARISCSPPTNYPVYRPGMELGREVGGAEQEGIHEHRAGSRSAHVEILSIFDESGGISNSPTPLAEKYEDRDVSRYWGTPRTSSAYLRSTYTPPPPSPPLPPTIPSTVPQKQLTSSRIERPERPERRTFRQLRDGDIVGDEASELPKANKGRLMMEKMGYKEGTALGTNEDRGLTEPVKVEIRLGKRGLGLAKQESALPPQASANQVNSNQRILPQIALAKVDQEENTHAITRQLQQMGIQQTMKYSLDTPLSACQTRLRMVQMLAQLDALELLTIVDYNYILAVSMVRVAEQQSRIGFLVDIDLIQIVTMEYKMAVLRTNQSRQGSSNEKVNKTSYW